MAASPGDGLGRVLVVGEALVDVRVDDGDPVGGPGDATVAEHPGGSPLNIAVGLARLGLPTTLATQVGDDARGAAVTRHAAGSGVELLRLPSDRPTSTATVRVGPGGAATYDFDVAWDPETLPDPAGFALLHVGSIAATLAPGADTVAGLVTAAASAAVPVSFDPNLRPGVTPDLDDVRRRFRTVAQGSTVVKLSDEDAALLRPDDDVRTVAAGLAALPGVRLAAVSLGADGLLLRTTEHELVVPAAAVEVVDTIGAGDTVMAALIAGLLLAASASPPGPDRLGPDRLGPRSLAWLGRLATTAAAVCCSRPGADPPWRTELPELSVPVGPTDG